MIVELGHFALVLAFLAACVQAVAGLYGAHTRNARATAIAPAAALSQALLATSALAALVYAFVVSDFSVRLVYENSHSQKPLFYKIAGVWGNHEGSMLLWIALIAILGAAVAYRDQNLPDSLRARVLGVQGLIGASFLAFSLFTSNPFLRLDPFPLDGRDLNPLLQDPGLVAHPPFLYLGLVGFSVAFSFAVGALLEGRVDPAWARWVRPWALFAWTSLTIGIALGSAWAYYELGWGGFWFWDPVENASLLPWLAGTALVHSAAVVEKRDALKAWTILMAIAAFTASALGTFVVRSGLLTSVHAFANDPGRGMALLAICCVLTGGALVLYALRAPALKANGAFQSVSRESALVVNNLLLSGILAAVALGTFWPIVAEALWGEKISVGAPYFTKVVTPIALVIAAVMSVGSLLSWKRASLKAALDKLRLVGVVALLSAAAGFWVTGQSRLLAAVGVAMAVWVIGGVLVDLAQRLRLDRRSWGEALSRAKGLPRSVWGGALAHGGLGLAVLGMVGTTLWKEERVETLTPGQTVAVSHYELRFEGVERRRGPNYETATGVFSLLSGGRVIDTLEPEDRFYPFARSSTTEAAIRLRPWGDLYVVLGEPVGDNARVVRATAHPLVGFIWAGSAIMAFGGALSLSDRRYRIGAPKRRTAPAEPAPAAAE